MYGSRVLSGCDRFDEGGTYLGHCQVMVGIRAAKLFMKRGIVFATLLNKNGSQMWYICSSVDEMTVQTFPKQFPSQWTVITTFKYYIRLSKLQGESI